MMTHCVDDADGHDGHNEENDERYDVVELGSCARFAGHVLGVVHQEAEFKVAAVRLIGHETRVGSRAVVLDRHLFKLEKEYVGRSVGERHDPAESHGQFAGQSGRNALIRSPAGRRQCAPPFDGNGQHAHNTLKQIENH